ncbi:hypothetical protein ACIRU3_46905 [Streptomyces sp. NPDC101151]|uniref:hypothetical protein n=1 Tax=Streptomyces sp. NPDC101151 TaxID=3366115 RepID=UPI00382FF409
MDREAAAIRGRPWIATRHRPSPAIVTPGPPQPRQSRRPTPHRTNGEGLRGQLAETIGAWRAGGALTGTVHRSATADKAPTTCDELYGTTANTADSTPEPTSHDTPNAEATNTSASSSGSNNPTEANTTNTPSTATSGSTSTGGTATSGSATAGVLGDCRGICTIITGDIRTGVLGDCLGICHIITGVTQTNTNQDGGNTNQANVNQNSDNTTQTNTNQT